MIVLSLPPFTYFIYEMRVIIAPCRKVHIWIEWDNHWRFLHSACLCIMATKILLWWSFINKNKFLALLLCGQLSHLTFFDSLEWGPSIFNEQHTPREISGISIMKPCNMVPQHFISNISLSYKLHTYSSSVERTTLTARFQCVCEQNDWFQMRTALPSTFPRKSH